MVCGPIVLDLETHDSDEQFNPSPSCGAPGPFVRVGGARLGDRYAHTTNVGLLAQVAQESKLVVTHNGIVFDLPVLGVDILAKARRRELLDTLVTEAVLDPPVADERSGAIGRAQKRYGLDATCERRGIPGKKQIKDLVKEFGGWCHIPVDHPEFLAYLEQDVESTRLLAAAQMANPLPDYVWREHRFAAILSVMCQAGFEANQPLLFERHAEVQSRKAELREKLVTRYGLPTTKADGKPSVSPHTTKEGRVALVEAFAGLGVPRSELPSTPTGAAAFGGEGMLDLANRHPESTDIGELCEVVADMAGLRSVYGTAVEYLHADGRVHPQVLTFQASGRLSVTKPGLTVFGKRGGRVVERDVFQAAEGSVLIAADLAQVDMRAVAAHSQDEAYIAVLSDPTRDLHSEIAARLWGGPLLKNPKRELAKPMGHGWNYGMQAEKMAESGGVSEREARDFDQLMRHMFPRLVWWRDQVRNLAASTGVLDNGFGRMMQCDRRRAFTQGPALMGQGTTRDLMAETMLRMPDEIARTLRVQIHDEVIAECRAEDAEEVAHELKKAMTFEWCPPWASIPVPIVCEVSNPSRSWSGCYAK